VRLRLNRTSARVLHARACVRVSRWS
jgi:hypothetical protein